MSSEIDRIEKKLNKTEQFWLNCMDKEKRWGSELIKIGNFTPMIEECSYFCKSYNLSYIITKNIAEDKIHDLESSIEGIERRTCYTDDYLCLCVS